MLLPTTIYVLLCERFAEFLFGLVIDASSVLGFELLLCASAAVLYMVLCITCHFAWLWVSLSSASSSDATHRIVSHRLTPTWRRRPLGGSSYDDHNQCGWAEPSKADQSRSAGSLSSAADVAPQTVKHSSSKTSAGAFPSSDISDSIFSFQQHIIGLRIAVRTCGCRCVACVAHGAVRAKQIFSPKQWVVLLIQSFMIVMSIVVICVAAFAEIAERSSSLFAFVFACAFVFFAGALANCESLSGIPMI
jgi:hypothetical protein